MKVLSVVIVVLATVFAVNSLPRARSTHELVELAKRVPRSLLEVELRAILAPGFKAAIDEAIVNLLNTTVRDIIKQGSEELGIPVLDPLKIERLDIDLNLDGLQLKGAAEKISVEGVSTFIVEKIKTNLLLLNAEFGVSVPQINVKGERYNIEGNVAGLIPIFGEGAFSISIKEIVLTGKVSLGSNNSFIYVKSLQLDLSIGKIETKLEGLLGGGILGDLANDILSSTVKEIWDAEKSNILPVVIEEIIKVANELLDGVTLQDILDLINGSGRKL